MNQPATKRYYVTRRGEPEKEVTREEYLSAERTAGFHSTVPGEEATLSFGSSAGLEGRVEYVESPTPSKAVIDFPGLDWPD